jgi:uncharacterized protein YjaG (DUF416 family)
MKLSYDVFIRHEVFRTLQGASARDQERVLDADKEVRVVDLANAEG